LLQLSSEHFLRFLESPYYAGLCEFNNSGGKRPSLTGNSTVPSPADLQQQKQALTALNVNNMNNNVVINANNSTNSPSTPQSPSLPNASSSAATPTAPAVPSSMGPKTKSFEEVVSHNVEEQTDLYSVVDLSTPKFSEQDFIKLVSLTKEDNSLWKPLVKRGDMTTFCSRSKFTLDKKKGIRIFRVYAEYDYPICTLHV